MAVRIVFCAALGVCAALLFTGGKAIGVEGREFPELPPPPPIDELIGLPQTYLKGRGVHLALVTRAAEEAGLPAEVADAVTQIESGYTPGAVGGAGEIGLMQVMPQTAAMLGYKGSLTGLFDPKVNVRLGVKYLAQAWQMTSGNLCRTLMKYRAGHGEERMTALSIRYCQRAREHLAAIGSPLARGALPPSPEPEGSVPPTKDATSAKLMPPASSRKELAQLRPPPRPLSPRMRAEATFVREVRIGQRQAHLRGNARTADDSRRFWAAHQERIRMIKREI